ncbi:MAG TPA: YggS family pyridoxal phosphate-dependent enzyme [Candidatus Saccharimonadales bacterium]|nr:YggS family pyridoxal phosphate-dependent enzyme [Candidatus Saccharimonadales bacterium]
MSIAGNLSEVRERIAQAARRAGRDAREVALMAVSKNHPGSAILEAIAAGQVLFGENRVQEFAGKRGQVMAASGTGKFHLIGHLQSNKAAKAAELFDAVDSVDSLRLAERLNDAAMKLNRHLDVLIEVNVGGEEAKSGLEPESQELRTLLEAQPRLKNLEIRGLMTVPPYTEDSEGARGCFRSLRELRDRLSVQSGLKLAELSMGMSHDFEVAIEEGSTCVRVGTAIFGARPYAAPYEESAG